MRKITKSLVALVTMCSIVAGPVFAAPSINSIKNDKKEAEAEMNSLQNELEETLADINRIETQMIEKGEAIIQATEDLEQAQVQSEEQYEAMKKRIVAMYENGNREPDFETLELIADYFNVTLGSLMSRPDNNSKKSNGIIVPVLGYVRCGEGEEETEEVIEYIRLPESLVGTGEFFVLIAKGDSMIDAGVNEGDYVVIRKQNTASDGDYVVALYEGLNNLKELVVDNGRYILRSCNEDKETYPDIYPRDLKIQGVAVCVMHRLKKRR